MQNDPTQAKRQEARPTVRRLGRELALLSAAPNRPRLEQFKVDLARLTAGLDPEADDSAFRFGAAEALGTMLNAFYEQDTFKGHPAHCICRGAGSVEDGPAGATYSVPCPRLRCLHCSDVLPEGRAYRCHDCDPLSTL